MTKKRSSLIFHMFLLFFPVVMMFNSCSKQEAKPNILLVTIDTLRRDHLGVYGYPRQTSPFIDHLAKNGVMFKHVITPIAITSGSHASILTSLHPLTHQCIKNGSPLPQNVQTIAEVLQENGYYTIGTTGVNFLSEENGFHQGFTSFSSPEKAKRGAEGVNEHLFAQIDKYRTGPRNKPLFIWVHYYDPHSPYLDREYTFKEKLPPRYDANPPQYLKKIDCYDSEIRYTDEAIKQVMDYLARDGLTENLVTCITADHGEQHGEHSAREAHHDFYSENTFVPLVFHGNTIPKNKVIEDFVSTMDISESLLNLAGLSFRYKTEGIKLIKSKQPANPDRAFLIIANPWRIKSLQLIRFPMSYIINFDRFYRDWYFSGSDVVAGNLFKKVKTEYISIDRVKGFNRLTLEFPGQFQPDLHYAAVRITLAEKQRISPIGVLFNKRIKTQANIDKQVDHLTLFHPVTTQDRNEIKIQFSVPQKTRLESIEYTFLSRQEFASYTNGLEKLKNQIHSNLNTRRKNLKLDEFYNLKQDLDMNHNLLKVDGVPVHKDQIDDYQKSLYRWFEFYFKKGEKIVGKNMKTKKLTPKQIEILKSLGYI